MRTMLIADRSRLERLLGAFQRSTGLDAAVVNADGETLLRVAGGHQSSPCRVVRATAGGAERCRACYAGAAATAYQLGEPYGFRCHAGLLCWAVPISGWPAPAAVVCRQVPGSEPEAEPQRARAAAELLDAIVNAGAPGPSGGVAPAGAAPGAVAAGAPAPPGLLEREAALLQRVRLRDPEGAAAILDGVLADLRGLPGWQAAARALELLALISRAVIESGGDQQQVLGQSAAYAERIRVAGGADAACAAVAEALGVFMAVLRPVAGGARHQLLVRVMEYLRENYHRHDLSLEKIARVVHLSPAYLSHLFSKELNMTMTQYLTSVRLEAAKALLRETDLPVSEVAARVGYEDAGYFCKIIRKYLKSSPGAYRQQFRAPVAMAR